MGQFRDVLLTLNGLKAEGVLRDYAIGGAVAVSLWTEPVATRDLDVIVTIGAGPHPLDPLRPVFDWFRQHGHVFQGEHVVVAGVPVQFLVAWSPLVEEAVAAAAETLYDPEDPASPVVRLIGGRGTARGVTLEGTEMTSQPGSPFPAKALWHAEQRQLAPRKKIAILIELQRREAESDRIRISLGRPASGLRPWDTQA